MSEHPMHDPLESRAVETVNATPVAKEPRGRRGRRVLAVVAGVAMVPALYAAASAVTGGAERPTVSAASGADDTATTTPENEVESEVETEHGVVTTPGASTPTTPTTPENEVEDEPSTSLPPTTTPDDTTSPPVGTLAPVTRTFDSTGGSITVTLANGVLSLDNVSAAAGYTPQVHDNDGSRVEVRFFDAQGKEWRIRIEVRGGSMTQEITFHG